jgi:hypothetical protein
MKLKILSNQPPGVEMNRELAKLVRFADLTDAQREFFKYEPIGFTPKQAEVGIIKLSIDDGYSTGSNEMVIPNDVVIIFLDLPDYRRRFRDSLEPAPLEEWELQLLKELQ